MSKYQNQDERALRIAHIPNTDGVWITVRGQDGIYRQEYTFRAVERWPAPGKATE